MMFDNEVIIELWRIPQIHATESLTGTTTPLPIDYEVTMRSMFEPNHFIKQLHPTWNIYDNNALRNPNHFGQYRRLARKRYYLKSPLPRDINPNDGTNEPIENLHSRPAPKQFRFGIKTNFPIWYGEGDTNAINGRPYKNKILMLIRCSSGNCGTFNLVDTQAASFTNVGGAYSGVAVRHHIVYKYTDV